MFIIFDVLITFMENRWTLLTFWSFWLSMFWSTKNTISTFWKKWPVVVLKFDVPTPSLCKQPYIFFYNNIGPYWTFPTSQSTYFDIVNTNSITKFYLSWLLVLTGIASTAIVYLICTSPLPCVSKVLRNQILKESNLILQPVLYLMHPFSINRVNTNV